MTTPSVADDARFSQALNNINASINATLDFDQILKSAISEASVALGCDTAGILLNEGDDWVIRYVHGYPADVIGRRYEGDHMPHAVEAARTRDVFAVPDALNDPRSPRERLREYGVRSMLVVPVIVRDAVIGAIYFNYRERQAEFSPAQIHFGKQLAAALSLALDNARLYGIERDHRARLQTLMDEQIQARLEAERLAGELREANRRLQSQADEVEVQAEALRSQNDELFAAHEELQRAHDELEQRVEQRTVSLQQTARDLARRESTLREEIAERRRAEAEVKEQAARLAEQAALLELTYDTILVRDLDAHILYWNRGAEERYGWSRDAVLGKRSHDLLQTQFPEPVEDVYATLLKAGRWEGELVHTRRDGSRIVVASRWSLQRDAAGKPMRVLETNNDITAHKQAEQTLWRNTRRLEILHEIDRAVLAARSSKEIAQTAAHHLRELIGCHRAAVILFDFERGLADRLAVDTPGETSMPAGSHVPLADYGVIDSGQQPTAYTMADIRALAAPEPRLKALADEGLRSYVSVPLAVQKRQIGNLNLSWTQPDGFTQADVDVAWQVADSLAVAIEQARLHERERQARELAEALRAANQALTRSLDLDEVLEALLSSLGRLVAYAAAQVLLLEEDMCLVVRARKGSGGASDLQFAAELPIRIFDPEQVPPLRAALDERQGVLIRDTLDYPGWERMPAIPIPARSWLGTPLIAGGKPIGLVALYGREPDAFTDDDLRTAESFAGQAAIAIQNAQLFRQVDAGRRQLQALSRRLVEVQEEERRYIARELHDEAGQGLTSLLVGLGLLERGTVDETTIERVRDLKETADGVMEELHRLALRLRPAALDRLGLVPALRQYVESFIGEHHLEGEFLAMGVEDERLLPEIEITVYRVVQEALTNIARHADASRVGVLLERRASHIRASDDSGPAPEHVVAIVEDNGRGFDMVEAARRGRLGLFGMQERAQMLGGSLVVESTPGQGTTVYLELPYVKRETGD